MLIWTLPKIWIIYNEAVKVYFTIIKVQKNEG